MADDNNEPREEQKGRYKNSRGIPWTDVPIGDLPGYIRDGIEAAALLKAIEDKTGES